MRIYYSSPQTPEQNDFYAQWCSERIWPGQNRAFVGEYHCLTFWSGDIKAVVVFHNIDKSYQTVELSIAAKTAKWLNSKGLRAIYDLGFRRIGAKTAIMKTDENNTRASSILKRLGFKPFLIPFIRGDQGELVHVLREDWS